MEPKTTAEVFDAALSSSVPRVLATGFTGGLSRLVTDGKEVWSEDWTGTAWALAGEIAGGADIAEVLGSPPVSAEKFERFGAPFCRKGVEATDSPRARRSGSDTGR